MYCLKSVKKSIEVGTMTRSIEFVCHEKMSNFLLRGSTSRIKSWTCTIVKAARTIMRAISEKWWTLAHLRPMIANKTKTTQQSPTSSMKLIIWSFESRYEYISKAKAKAIVKIIVHNSQLLLTATSSFEANCFLRTASRSFSVNSWYSSNFCSRHQLRI